jgi:hypothetical protein
MKTVPALSLAVAGLTAFAGIAQAASGKAGGETAIPFASSNGIADWQVAADNLVYIKAINGDWFLVRTMANCPRLYTARALGFITRSGQLDRHGAILAEGDRCAIDSVVQSGAPPKKRS